MTDHDHPDAPADRPYAGPDAESCDLCDLVLTGPGRPPAATPPGL